MLCTHRIRNKKLSGLAMSLTFAINSITNIWMIPVKWETSNLYFIGSYSTLII